MLHFGVISAVDSATCRVRVTLQADELVTDFLPVMQSATLNSKGYKMYDVGEHVVVLMDENAEAGVVLGAIYSDADAPAAPATGAGEVSLVLGTPTAGVTLSASRANATATVRAAGTVHAESTGAHVELKAGQKVKIEAGGKLRVDANGENLHTLMGKIGQFLQLHNHTVSGVNTVTLLPADLVKAQAIVLSINNLLE